MPSISRRHDEPVAAGVQTSEFTAQVEKLYRLDPSGGTFTCHLPTASGVGGQDILLYVAYSGSNQVIVLPSGSEIINGGASLVLGSNNSVILTSNGIDEWIGFGAP